MLVVMKHGAEERQIEQVCRVIREMGLAPHPIPGKTRTAIGITGNIGAVDPRALEVLPGVLELLRAELRVAMQQLGAPSLGELTPAMVRRA